MDDLVIVKREWMQGLIDLAVNGLVTTNSVLSKAQEMIKPYVEPEKKEEKLPEKPEKKVKA